MIFFLFSFSYQNQFLLINKHLHCISVQQKQTNDRLNSAQPRANRQYANLYSEMYNLNELLRQFTDETEKPSISTSMVNQRLSAQWNSILLLTQ